MQLNKTIFQELSENSTQKGSNPTHKELGKSLLVNTDRQH